MSDAIHRAAKDGNMAALKKASKKELNRPGEDGWTAVHWAAWSGNPDTLRIILDKGGDPDCPDSNGFTALHVAAKYGNTAAAEVMLNREKEVNLWALDNLGRTPARVAAVSKKSECCRLLDTLATRWQMENPDYAGKMQTKAMKELSKRAERDAKAAHREERKDPKKRTYSHSTAPSGDRTPDLKSSSATQLNPTGRKKKGLVPAEAIRQNFELRQSSSAEHINQDRETTVSGPEEDEGGVLRPAGVRTGPLLNTLKSLPKGHLGGISQESVIASSSDSHPSNSRRSSGSATGGGGSGGLSDVMLSLQPIVIENDSPLATFLQSLDLMDHIQLLHREKLDLEALALCKEKDLSDIGLPLGPRKKILNAIQRRRTLLKKPGRMVDTKL